VKLSTQVGGCEFQNPLILASGTFGYGDRFPEVINQVGGIITKALTLLPRPGNPPPRIYELPGGIVNSVGLENPGLDRFKAEILPELKGLKTNLFVNLVGDGIEDYEALVEALTDEPQITGFELNISCPNLKGPPIGQDPERTAELVERVRARSNKFLIVKLSANFIDPSIVAQRCARVGADAVSLINSLYALVVDRRNRRPFLGGGRGGLSGPAIHPFALYCVYRTARTSKLPVIGGGGVVDGGSCIDFLLAGAPLVSVGSANLIDPFISLKIIKELRDYCAENQIEDIAQLVGSLKFEEEL
jgi:dihydroorotate dehydrogenase (NAD+) catalytic subunit